MQRKITGLSPAAANQLVRYGWADQLKIGIATLYRKLKQYESTNTTK